MLALFDFQAILVSLKHVLGILVLEHGLEKV